MNRQRQTVIAHRLPGGFVVFELVAPTHRGSDQFGGYPVRRERSRLVQLRATSSPVFKPQSCISFRPLLRTCCTVGCVRRPMSVWLS